MNNKKIFAYGARNLFFAFAVIFALALATAACDNGSTSGGPTGDPNSSTYTGYDGDGKEYKLVISKAVSGPGTGDNPGTGTRDSRLVNGADDVWADSYPAGERDGFIFKADGACHIIDDYTDTTPGVWAIFATGSWTTSGDNSLTLSGNGGSKTYSYTVTSTTLILTGEDGGQTFTKTTATVSGRSAVSPSSAGKAGNKAVIGAIKRVALSQSSPAYGRAVYAPKSGDEFTLTIKNTITGAIGGTSTGTVSDISGDTLKLDNDGKEFRAKIKGLFIDELPDSIPLDGGGTLPAPGTLTPPSTGVVVNGLTITGLPSGQWNVFVFTAGTDISNFDALAIMGSDKREAGNYGATVNSVSPLFLIGSEGPSPNTIWKGSGSRAVAINEGGTAIYYRATANFSNGNATVPFSSFTLVGGGGGDTNGPTDWIAVTDSTFGTSITDTSLINDIAYGNGRFVAVGYYGKMAYSDDGITWTAVANSGFSNIYEIYGIAYGNGKFVAAGGNGTIAYSDDGISWTAANKPFSTYIYAIAFGDGKFIIGGHSSKMATSSDGITWTAVEVSDIFGGSLNDRISVIAYGNGRFVAAGHTGDYIHKMATSTDGASWTAVTDIPSNTAFIEAIAFSDGRFVMGRSNGLWYSANGTSWTAAVGQSRDSSINDIVYGKNRFVAVARGDMIMYSSDGVSWTRGPNISGSYNAVAYGNGRFVAVGSEGKMVYCDW